MRYSRLSAPGAWGDVYKGRDIRLQRTIAIKILKLGGRERFEREARCISALNHLHSCDLYDIGYQDGLDFLITEYLEGDTLARRPDGLGSVVAYRR